MTLFGGSHCHQGNGSTAIDVVARVRGRSRGGYAEHVLTLLPRSRGGQRFDHGERITPAWSNRSAVVCIPRIGGGKWEPSPQSSTLQSADH